MMKMKKLLAVLMTLVVTASTFTACGNSKTAVSENPSVEENNEKDNSKDTQNVGSASKEDTSSAENDDETENADKELSSSEIAEETDNTAEETTAPDLYKGLIFYESSTGISLYMSKGFSETSAEGTLCCWEGTSSSVSCAEETFESLEAVGYSGALTEEEYAELIRGAYQIDGEVQTTEYGNVYVAYTQDITYAADADPVSVSYYSFFIKGTSSFFTFNFMCMTEEASQHEEDFYLWASSITVP